MGFERSEVIFFSVIALAGALSSAGRICSDRDVSDFIGVLGRCISGGSWSFGIIGYWIGADPSIAVGSIYYVAIAVTIGRFTKDFDDVCKELFKKLLKNFILKWLRGAGYIEKKDS